MPPPVSTPAPPPAAPPPPPLLAPPPATGFFPKTSGSGGLPLSRARKAEATAPTAALPLPWRCCCCLVTSLDAVLSGFKIEPVANLIPHLWKDRIVKHVAQQEATSGHYTAWRNRRYMYTCGVHHQVKNEVNHEKTRDACILHCQKQTVQMEAKVAIAGIPMHPDNFLKRLECVRALPSSLQWRHQIFSDQYCS